MCANTAASQGLLFDAKTGDKVGVLEGHTGAIFACSWSPDGTKIMTSSADKTVRVWDIATQANTTYGQTGRVAGRTNTRAWARAGLANMGAWDMGRGLGRASGARAGLANVGAWARCPRALRQSALSLPPPSLAPSPLP